MSKNKIPVWYWFGGKHRQCAGYVNETQFNFLRSRGLTGEPDYPPPPKRGGRICKFWDWHCPVIERSPTARWLCGGQLRDFSGFGLENYPAWVVLALWSDLDSPYIPPQQLDMFEPIDVWYPWIGLEQQGPRPNKSYWLQVFYCQAGARMSQTKQREEGAYSVEVTKVMRNRTDQGNWGRKVRSRQVELCERVCEVNGVNSR